MDSTSPRGRGQEDVKESEQESASECSKVKFKAKPLNGAQLADPAAWRVRGRMQDHGERRECDETPKATIQEQPNQRRGVVD